MGRVAVVHASIVEHQIRQIDQVAVEDQGTDSFSHVTAGLPASVEAGGLQPCIEAHHRHRNLLEATGDLLPGQFRKLISSRRR
jgi:hypothetical protein